jgi:hypothetical protein
MVKYEHSNTGEIWTECKAAPHLCEFRFWREREVPASTGKSAADWLRSVADLLEKKAASYGDSIGNPVRIFSRSDKDSGIRVRIDDKLSRIKNGSDSLGDNDLQDLVGYLALLAVVDKAGK